MSPYTIVYVKVKNVNFEVKIYDNDSGESHILKLDAYELFRLVNNDHLNPAVYREE